jgi:hypothetical protein
MFFIHHLMKVPTKNNFQTNYYLQILFQIEKEFFKNIKCSIEKNKF